MLWIIIVFFISLSTLAQPPLPSLQGNFDTQPLTHQLLFEDKQGPVFTLRNVRLEDKRNQLSIQHGGKVKMEFEYKFHCRHCKRSLNQLLIGLDFQHSAQICLHNARGRSKWKTASVELSIPDLEGNYYIRARHSDAFNCKDALDWWRLDLPLGPNSRANIGVVQVIKPKMHFTFNDAHSLSDFSIPINMGASK